MEGRKIPIRTCVSCRQSSEKRTLVRIVRTADGTVCVDPTGKMPGRGAYLCRKKDCLSLAIKHRKLGKALRCEIPESLNRELETTKVKNDAEQ